MMLWKQPPAAPGQLKMLVIRLAGRSVCAVAAVPPPRPGVGHGHGLGGAVVATPVAHAVGAPMICPAYSLCFSRISKSSIQATSRTWASASMRDSSAETTRTPPSRLATLAPAAAIASAAAALVAPRSRRTVYSRSPPRFRRGLSL